MDLKVKDIRNIADNNKVILQFLEKLRNLQVPSKEDYLNIWEYFKTTFPTSLLVPGYTRGMSF